MKIINVLKKILGISILITISACGGGGGTGSSSQPLPPGPQSATLSWDPVTLNADGTPCTDLAGYCVYYGEQSPVTSNNSQKVVVGNTTTAQIGNLVVGHTYYFRLSSYDTSNNESAISSVEASKTID